MESFIITLIKKHILDFYDDFVLKEEENKEETTSLLFNSVTTEWLCVDQQTVHRTIIPGQNSIEKKHLIAKLIEFMVTYTYQKEETEIMERKKKIAIQLLHPNYLSVQEMHTLLQFIVERDISLEFYDLLISHV